MNGDLPQGLKELVPAGQASSLGPNCLLINGEKPFRVKYGCTLEQGLILQREALWLNRVRHVEPPTHRCLALKKHGIYSVLITNYIQGKSASEWIKEHHAECWFADATAGYVDGFIRALDSLHNAGIVHGDIKLGNILYTGKRYACLIDFANARRLGEPLQERGVMQFSRGYRYPKADTCARFEHDYFAALLCVAALLDRDGLVNCVCFEDLFRLIELHAERGQLREASRLRLAELVHKVSTDLGQDINRQPLPVTISKQQKTEE